MAQTDDILSRRVEKVLPGKNGLDKLMKKRRIRLYNGIDPTGTRLHLGHSIPLKKLREFADAGHEVMLLFGTGTVKVGDPSLRATARKSVTDEEIEKNIATWKEQASKILDFSKVKIVKNGDWIDKLTLKDMIGLMSKVSAVQLFKRESFTRRIKAGDTVWYHETLYPLLQGYDSVVMDVDLEIGGTDQEFNMLMGRELQKKINGKDKWVMTLPMIVGTDGNQMSKTSGNCIWLDDTPGEMYGKIMSLADEHMWSYFDMVTDVGHDEINDLKKQVKSGLNPKEAKVRLAKEIVTMYHGQDEADKAGVQFEKQFKDHSLPEEIPTFTVNKDEEYQITDLLADSGLVESKSQARRLLSQGAIRLNQKKIEAETIKPSNGDVLQAGKRRFIQLKVK